MQGKIEYKHPVLQTDFIANASQTMIKHAESAYSLLNKTENLTKAKNRLNFTINKKLC